MIDNCIKDIYKIIRFFQLKENRNRKYVYDKSRKKEVAATPEEKVRQAVVAYFRWILHTPIRYIQTEISMKRYGYIGNKDRADIIVLRPDGETVLAVIECKADYVEISKDVIAQMLRYAETLNAEFAFSTNGKKLVSYGFDKKRGYVPITCPASYKSMNNSWQNTLSQNKTICGRASLEKLRSAGYIRKHYDRYIGRGTKEELLPFIANLCDCLREIQIYLKPKEYSGFTLEQDLGVRTLEIVVPGGAVFNNSNYRMFEVRDRNALRYTIGMAVSVYGSTEKEKTILAVAVDAGHRCHHALQLILDTNVMIREVKTGKRFEVTHNAKINVGRKGTARIRDVLQFIKNEIPTLVRDDQRVYLGSFSDDELISVTSPDFKEFFENLINYVLLLEKFREIKLRGANSEDHAK